MIDCFHGIRPEPLSADLLPRFQPSTHAMWEWQEYWVQAPEAEPSRWVGSASLLATQDGSL